MIVDTRPLGVYCQRGEVNPLPSSLSLLLTAIIIIIIIIILIVQVVSDLATPHPQLGLLFDKRDDPGHERQLL